MLEDAELLARVGVGHLLTPGVLVTEESVDDLDLLVAADRAGRAVELAEGAKEGGADTPLTLLGTAPGVVGPSLESGLDEVAGAVGHAGPQEEHAVLCGGRGAGDEGGDGLDDGGLGRAERHGTSPGVGSRGADEGGSQSGEGSEVHDDGLSLRFGVAVKTR